MRSLYLCSLLSVAAGLASGSASCRKRPNIILIMTDDQDLRLGSMDYQSVLHRELMDKGTEFLSHYTTTANCCPSRASFLRGQQTHNTNITHVNAPGGNYDKFVTSGQDEDYLPHWLKRAGYRTEYLGKLLNGYNTVNYNSPAPKGWDFINSLTDPYTMDFNHIVMSENGEKPRLYEGFHQTDIIRAQALDRLEYLTGQKQPFFLTIAPTVPHEQYDYFAPVPLTRHMGMFPNATAPRHPNWNPSDEFQRQKSHWMKELPPLTEEWIEFGDWLYQQRVESLQGVDEIIEDVISLLDDKEVLDNTYIIFTTDNGWHIGMDRIPAGKATPYAEDTNLPFVVRGPGVPAGVKSTLPGSHLDLAPTFLEIAGVDTADQPALLDGRSLLSQWHEPSASYDGQNTGVGRELLNVEFWGLRVFEAPADPIIRIPNNSYKSLRLVGDEYSWLFVKWCNNEMELYDTHADPWELTNLARSDDPDVQRLLSRLNAILLVTKSCTTTTCRDPWLVLQPTETSEVSSLTQALDPAYDEFYAGLPEVRFGECMNYQSIENEAPFYPPGAAEKMAEFRRSTDNFVTVGARKVLEQDLDLFYGGPEQRHVRWEEIKAASRELTDAELGASVDKRSIDEMHVLEWYN